MNGLFLTTRTLIFILLTTLYKCENYESLSDIKHMKNNADKVDNETEPGYNQASNGTRITDVTADNQTTTESSTDNLTMTESSTDNLTMTESSTDNLTTTDSSTENQTTTDSATENQTTTESTTDNQMTTVSTDNQTTTESTTDNQTTTESTDNQTMTESTTDNQTTTESTDNQTMTESSTDNLTTTDSSTENQTMTDSATENQTTSESTTDNQTTTESTDNQTMTESSTENLTTTDPSTENQTMTDLSTENQTTTEASTENQMTTVSSTENQTTTDLSKKTLPETDSPTVSQQTQSTTENPSVTELETVTQSVAESQSSSLKSSSIISTQTPTTRMTITITTEGHTETTGNIPTSPKDISINSSTSEQSTPSTTANSKTSICKPNPCLFGGNCSEISEEEYNCSCGEGLTGKNCEILDSCVSNGPGGFCKNGKCVYAFNHRIRYCECLPGFYFDFLHKECLHGTDIGECIKQNPCPKTTDCLNTKEGYCCVCKRGYRLANYFSIPEKDGCIELCNPNPCVHGECNIIEGRTFNCSCETGYTGDFCEEEEGKKTYVDACVKDNPCPDTTECLNIKGNYTCRCKAGFRLANSSSDASIDGCVEICNPNPCVRGICIKYGANMYQCSCEAGYTGALCDKENGELKHAKRTSVIVGTLLGIFLIIAIIVFMETLRRLKKRKPDEETTELFYGTSEMILNRTTNFSKNQNLRKISKKHTCNSCIVEKCECEVREP